LAIPIKSIAVVSFLDLVWFDFAAACVHARISITTLNTTYTRNSNGMGDGDLLLPMSIFWRARVEKIEEPRALARA
jgi:hypothetical protein